MRLNVAPHYRSDRSSIRLWDTKVRITFHFSPACRGHPYQPQHDLGFTNPGLRNRNRELHRRLPQ
jgi:hypothetical protein